MCFSDSRFPYGPFPPHWVPRHYVENYFSLHRTDRFLVLSTTVEDLSRIPGTHKWKLTLRRKDSVRHLDVWWEEEFDAVILANGHYAVPFVSLLSKLTDQALCLSDCQFVSRSLKSTALMSISAC